MILPMILDTSSTGLSQFSFYKKILYERARKSGAIGGKLLGAGGGFLLFVVPPEKRDSVIQALIELKKVQFAFDNIDSSLLFYQPVRK